jgi:hypothetical protein
MLISYLPMQKLLSDANRTKTHVIKVIEGFETIMFKSKFKEWPQTPDLKLSSEDGRGKVAGYCFKIYRFQCFFLPLMRAFST